MIIKRRTKLFANPQQPEIPEQPSPKDLQIENMKMQRQIMLNNRMRDRIQSQEQNAKFKALAQIQKSEDKKDEVEMNNRIKVQKMQENSQNPADRNWNLVKSKAKPSTPVPMKS